MTGIHPTVAKILYPPTEHVFVIRDAWDVLGGLRLYVQDTPEDVTCVQLQGEVNGAVFRTVRDAAEELFYLFGLDQSRRRLVRCVRRRRGQDCRFLQVDRLQALSEPQRDAAETGSEERTGA